MFALVKLLPDNRTSTAENNYLVPFESTDAGLTEEDWINLLSTAGGVKLSSASPSQNHPFSLTNMFPGDSVTQTFVVNVKDRDARELHFALRLVPGSQKLAEVLNIRIFTATVDNPISDEPLYDGTFAALSELTLSNPLILDLDGNSSEKIYYAICVSLDTSADNEYQNLALEAQFAWDILTEEDGTRPIYTSRRPRPTTATTTTEEPETSTSLTETTPAPETSTSIIETTPEPETSNSVSETTPPPETSTSISETTPAPDTSTSVSETETTTTTPPVTTEPEEQCNCALNLPWCGEDTCLCPWCWLIPLLVILAAAAVTAWLVYRRLKKDKDKKPKGGPDDNVQSSE